MNMKTWEFCGDDCLEFSRIKQCFIDDLKHRTGRIRYRNVRIIEDEEV